MQDLHPEWKEYYEELEDIRFFGSLCKEDTVAILAKRHLGSLDWATEIATYWIDHYDELNALYNFKLETARSKPVWNKKTSWKLWRRS